MVGQVVDGSRFTIMMGFGKVGVSRLTDGVRTEHAVLQDVLLAEPRVQPEEDGGGCWTAEDPQCPIL